MNEVKTAPSRTVKGIADSYEYVRKNSVAGSIVLPDVGAIMEGDPLELAGVLPLGKVANILGDAAKALRIICSFDGSTLVLAEGGAKAIRDVLPGKDRVWGLDANGDGSWHDVLGQTVATYDHKVMVTIRDFETGTEQTITSNRIHPYFAQVPEDSIVPLASEGFVYEGPLANGHWIDAGNLKPGYRLFNSGGTWAEVVLVTEIPAMLDAWNLTVKDAHSYFVAEKEGADPVWVHNKCSVYESVQSYQKARNRGTDLISGLDPSTRTPVVGKFGKLEGKIVGFRGKTFDGTAVQFRLDWDSKIGAHFNVLIGKGASATNYHIQFPGSQDDVLTYLSQFQ